MICAALSFLISGGSFFRVAKCLAGHCVPFASSYSMGNLVSLASTGFIVGLQTQCKSMFEGHRALAAGVYLSSIVVTLFVALYKGEIILRGLLLLVCVAVQCTSYIFYMLSYIPFGRR